MKIGKNNIGIPEDAFVIDSIESILEAVTDENIDEFLDDFKSYIETCHALHGLVQAPKMHWKPDGKKTVNIIINQPIKKGKNE